MLELFYGELTYINIYGAISLNLDYRKNFKSTIKEIMIFKKNKQECEKTDYQGMGSWQFTSTERPVWTEK